ncbi:hypothetical protein GTY67_13570 [Streptomyces sp. SID8374]|uniref:hypothetical protein n=1 Tax=Streptomyces sp. SID8374 TaxID=2690354 RepID=UPI00136AD3B4|nr:hypothetical protein [Streptomyces sp. SID8374]MYX14426.1 hypothetical protein [Streptomyces sp. SID8374]
MTSNLRANAALVEALGSALREGEHGLKTGPALLVRVLREESWRSFVTQRGERVEHERFEQFVVAAPLKGLGASMRLIGKLIDGIEESGGRAEARDLLDRASGSYQGRRVDLLDKIQEVPPGVAPTGTSREAGLRRLRKDRPDLHAEVLAGHLSTHAAMVRAGFRRKLVSVPVDKPESAAQALRRNMDPEAVAQLAKLLAEEA